MPTLIAPRRELPDQRTLRLAELVQHLTGCAPRGALTAVEEHAAADPLDVVARAMVRLRHETELRAVS